MPLTYTIKDRDGRTITTVPDVIAPVALTGVETSSGSNLVTVASTASLYPGMPVAISNIPPGAFIHAIRSSTVIELWRSAFSTSGAWSTTAANANASTATTGMSGYAYGYHHACLIELAYAMGMWRNLHTSNGGLGGVAVATGTELVAHETFGRGVALVPTSGSVSAGLYVPTAFDVRTADTLAATPVKRDNGERWGMRPFVQTGGALSQMSGRPDWQVIRSAAT